MSSYLKREFGDRFVEDKYAAALYARDALISGAAARILGVVFPIDESEVVKLVKWAIETKTPLFPQGSATSLSGNAAATAPGVVVSFEKMTKLEIHPTDAIAIAQPGVRIEEMNAELSRYGLLFPVDPGSAKSATIGGAIANGAGGMRGVKYGTIRDWVLGLRVVTGRGDLLRLGCRTHKCRNGYDLVKLFIGSEGTLGLITEATVKLAPTPASVIAILAYYDDIETLVEDVAAVRTSGVWPLFAEFVDAPTAGLIGLEERNALFLGVDVVQGAEEWVLEKLSKIRGDIAQTARGFQNAMKLLEPRRKLFYGQIAAARRDGGILVIEDVAVPVSKLPTAVKKLKEAATRRGLPLLLGGHVGDGNLHPATWHRGDFDRVKKFLEDMAEIVLELGGTISAEHGVGLLKRELLAREVGEGVLRYMAEVKKLFDPHNVLNPGKVL